MAIPIGDITKTKLPMMGIANKPDERPICLLDPSYDFPFAPSFALSA
jgi:hypothetical protein